MLSSHLDGNYRHEKTELTSSLLSTNNPNIVFPCEFEERTLHYSTSLRQREASHCSCLDTWNGKETNSILLSLFLGFSGTLWGWGGSYSSNLSDFTTHTSCPALKKRHNRLFGHLVLAFFVAGRRTWPAGSQKYRSSSLDDFWSRMAPRNAGVFARVMQSRSYVTWPFQPRIATFQNGLGPTMRNKCTNTLWK